MSTVQQKLAYFKSMYRVLAPNEDSLKLTQDAWDKWERDGFTRPDINSIAENHAGFDKGLFDDVVLIADKAEGQVYNIHYAPFCFDDYNFHGYHAEDGYIVLADEYFLQLLFILCLIFTYSSVEMIYEEEKEAIASLVKDLVSENYLRKKRFNFDRQKKIIELLERDYEVSELVNYLVNAFKIFIFAHETGHHVLGHIEGSELKRPLTYGHRATIEVDNPSIADEFEADYYGYKTFKRVLEISGQENPAQEIYGAFCKYDFYYAPLFLFDLFEKLDRCKERKDGKPIQYKTHPKPGDRRDALIKAFNIDVTAQLYLDLKKSLDMISC